MVTGKKGEQFALVMNPVSQPNYTGIIMSSKKTFSGPELLLTNNEKLSITLHRGPSVDLVCPTRARVDLVMSYKITCLRKLHHRKHVGWLVQVSFSRQSFAWFHTRTCMISILEFLFIIWLGLFSNALPNHHLIVLWNIGS